MIHPRKLAQLIIGIFASIVGSAAAAADSDQVKVTAVPDWFRPAEKLDLAAASDKGSPAPSATGTDYLLVDRQVDLASGASTIHVVYRITSEAGLSEAATLTRDFDPSYESLEYHFVRLWRQGVAQDRLNLAECKVLQQERDLDRQLYNGKLSAVMLLRDVRVGDIVEYSLTLRGRNPVFGGKYIDVQTFGWVSPVHRQSLRLIVPAGRTIHFRLQGEVELAHATRPGSNGATELVWDLRKWPGRSYESDAPSWFVQYAYLELSEFANWHDVIEWARPLYASDAPLPDDVKQKAEQLIRGLLTEEEKALVILDFVQREVRYLGFELGPNSHQPHEPGEVFGQRYGDCKDKTRLLCAMLAHVGVVARPVLVSTHLGEKAGDHLPSPFVFNHVVAVVTAGGRDYWVDPTQNFQRGDLAARGFDVASTGLVIPNKPGGRLTPMTIPASGTARPRLSVEQDFEITGYDVPVKLQVTYRYEGSMADTMRYYLANNSPDKVSRDFLDLQKRSYPQLVSKQSLKWNDKERQNMIVITYGCEIPNFWENDASGNVAQAEFYPWTINSYITQPENLTRQSPLALSHPVTTECVFNVHLPDKWSLRDSQAEVASPNFKYSYTASALDRNFQLHYRWESLSDHVPMDQLAEHVEKLAEVRRHTGYVLTRNLKLTRMLETPSTPWTMIVVTIVTIAAWGWFGWWINRRPAPPPMLAPPHPELKGISGWLVLPALGMILRPISFVAAFSEGASVYFDSKVWLSITVAESNAYQPALAVGLVLELVAKLSLLALSFITSVLFFRTKRQLPAMITTLLGSTVLFLVIEHYFSHGEDAAASSAEWVGIVQATGQAVVWIPYFWLSRRVKATFVN